MAQTNSLVHFSGHKYLRHRLVLSILSGKSVRIDKIRSEDKNPGLRGIYMSFHVVRGRLTSPFQTLKSAFYVYLKRSLMELLLKYPSLVRELEPRIRQLLTCCLHRYCRFAQAWHHIGGISES